MKKVAVVLSGCGYLDGAEITEAISTLVAIGQNGAEYSVFAPNKDVPETNHLTQKPTGQSRNVMQEAARKRSLWHTLSATVSFSGSTFVLRLMCSFLAPTRKRSCWNC